MNLLKTPHQKLMEEAGVNPSSPGMLNTPQQLLMQEAGMLPHMADGGQPPPMSPQDMMAYLVANGYLPQHFAEGGQPEMGVARAYENSPSEAVHDWFADKIGNRTADRLFGGPRADAADRLLLQTLNPINYATGVADSAKNFYESSKAGDYPGAMMNYGIGVLNALPFLGKGKTLLQRLVSPASVKENLPNMGLGAVSELGPLKPKK